MSNDHVAKARTTIAVPVEQVWDALTNPDLIRKYMFGTDAASDWQPGSPITWKGEWKGKPYEDKGQILRADRPRLLEYTHFSPLSGEPDVPENYHTVTIELAEAGDGTAVTLSQNGNATEEAREHSENNWSMVIEGMKKVLEE
jgi:uncharacterized protein YndB with AHSA1/START domain